MDTSAQNTKVTYKAVSDFTDLSKDIDGLLARLEVLKKSQKEFNKLASKKTAGTGQASSGTQKPADSGKEELKNLKDKTVAQRQLTALELRGERAKLAAQELRGRKARHTQTVLEKGDKRAQGLQERSDKRRAKRLDALLSAELDGIARKNKLQADADKRRKSKLDEQTATDNANSARERRKADNAQKRRDANAKARDDKANRDAKNEDARQAKIRAHDLSEELKDKAKAAAEVRAEELTASRKLEAEKSEANRERIRQNRHAARDQEKDDKQRATDLLRKLAAARGALDDVNREASGANRFTSRKVKERNVGEVKVKYDETKDANYFAAVARARELEIKQIERATSAINREMDARGGLYNLMRKLVPASSAAGTSMSKGMRGPQGDIKRTTSLTTNLRRNLDAIGRWRPRLIPPFIALIPILSGLLGLINPLVAGLGAIGGAAIGLAGNIGSLAGAALSAVPALAALLSVGTALKMAFGGVGKALKAADKMGKAQAAQPEVAKDNKEELTQEEQIARAQEKHKRSIEDVKDATEDLADAKKAYLDRLKEIGEQLEKIRMSEDRLAANAQLAKENYYNVLADPGSTKGEKMDAAVRIDEAKQDITDSKTEKKKLETERTDMKKGGMSGDKGVRDADRRLTDAIWAQRDAEIDLANAIKGTDDATSKSVAAVEEYTEAMDELSPSAQRVVEQLLAMKPAWDEVKKSVQESFFSEFVDDIHLLAEMFPTLNNLLGKSAGALGRVASKSLKLVSSDKWLRDLNELADQNVPLIENVGDGLLDILDAFKDIAIAAGPFTEALTEGFAEGAENFKELVAEARDSGSLAEWLETVRGRLSTWWTVIKNIGTTLFNYSAAASDFGDWLAEGFVKVSDGWREASEDARKEDSPFKVWLEDVKPALQAVKDMFAAFFKWFGAEASNKDNIEGFTEIVRTITEKVGPALKRVFDALSDAGIGETLVDTIGTVLDTIATLLEGGMADAIQAFYDTVSAVAEVVAAIASGVKALKLDGLLSALGVLAAMRFLGVTKLFGWFLKGGFASKIGNIAGSFLGLGDAFGSANKKGGKLFGTLGKLSRGGLIGLGVAAVVGVNELVVGGVSKGAGDSTSISEKIQSGASSDDILKETFGGLKGYSGVMQKMDVFKWGGEASENDFSSLLSLADDFDYSFGPITSTAGKAKEAWEQFGTALADMPLADSTALIQKMQEEQGFSNETLKKSLDYMGPYKKKLENAASAAGLSTDKNTLLEISQGKLNTELMTTEEKLQKISDHYKENNNKAINAEKANLAYKDSLARVSAAAQNSSGRVGDYVASLDDSTEEGRNNIDMLLDHIEQIDNAAEAQYKATGNSDEYYDSLVKGKDKLKELLEQFGLLPEEAEKFAEDYMKLPSKKVFTAKLDAEKAKEDMLKLSQTEIDDLDASINVTANYSGMSPFMKSYFGLEDTQLGPVSSSPKTGSDSKSKSTKKKFSLPTEDQLIGSKSIDTSGLAKGGGKGGVRVGSRPSGGTSKSVQLDGPTIVLPAPTFEKVDAETLINPIKNPSGKGGFWAKVFGEPTSWLNKTWGELPEWFAENLSTLNSPMEDTVKNVVNAWSTGWTSLKTSFKSVKDSVVGYWGDLATDLQSVWLKRIYNTLATFRIAVKDKTPKDFSTGVETMKKAWNGLQTDMNTKWTSKIKPIFTKFTEAVKTSVPEAFTEARKGIETEWGKIEKAAKEPVKFVVDVVLGGLVDAINGIKGVNVKKPTLPEGFHDGGHTGNRPWREAVGVVHGDEHVIRASSRQKIERSNPGVLDHMNTYGEIPGYKKGGLVNPLPAGTYNVTGPYTGPLPAHSGIDLAAAEGTKVYAAADGKVTMAQSVNLGGNEIYIQHDNGLGTRYSHLSRFAARPGDKVKAGNIIGYVGSTGQSSGPHLHYQVHNPGGGAMNYGNTTDPAGWMNGNFKDIGLTPSGLARQAAGVSKKISDKFPDGGMWVDAAKGLAKQAAASISSEYGSQIGTDMKKTLYDTGGKLKPGSTMVQNNTGGPEAILTAPQWNSMYEVHSMLSNAFSGLGKTSALNGVAKNLGEMRNFNTSLTGDVDKRIIIEKVEINNPVGDTSTNSLANTVRDMNYLRGR